MTTTTLVSNKWMNKTVQQTDSNNVSSKKQSSEDWERLIFEWKNSGLSQKKFCERHKMNFHNFVYHRNRVRKNQGKFATVSVTSKHSSSGPHDRFILQLKNGTKLAIPSDYDSVALKKLLTLLEVLPC